MQKIWILGLTVLQIKSNPIDWDQVRVSQVKFFSKFMKLFAPGLFF